MLNLTACTWIKLVHSRTPFVSFLRPPVLAVPNSRGASPVKPGLLFEAENNPRYKISSTTLWQRVFTVICKLPWIKIKINSRTNLAVQSKWSNQRPWWSRLELLCFYKDWGASCIDETRGENWTNPTKPYPSTGPSRIRLLPRKKIFLHHCNGGLSNF